MQKLWPLLSLVLLFTANINAQESLNKRVLNGVKNTEVSKLYPYFSQEMKNYMDSNAVDEMWISLASRFGSLDSIGASEIDKKDTLTVYKTPLFMKKMALTLSVSISNKDSIMGIFMRPYENKNNYLTPSYAHYNSFTESKDYIYSDVYLLPSILTLPKDKGPFPLVILVHGSGPQDMDESIGSNKPFRDIAYGLASQGIAVLRYDKRTYAYKKQIAKDINSLGIYEETVNDAVQAAKQMAKNPKIDPNRIYILGHSQGGMMAPAIYENAEIVKGLILMAAPARSLGSLILEQQYWVAREDSVITEEEQEVLVRTANTVSILNNKRRLKKSPIESFFGLSKNYWMSFNDYKQIKAANETEAPMLILQGSRDFQVTDTDYELWQEKLKLKDVTFHYYEGLNHLMMMGEGRGSLEEYYIPGNVDAQVITDIISWINKH